MSPPLAACFFVPAGLALWLGCLWRVRAAGVASIVLSMLTITAIPLVWTSMHMPLFSLVETVGSRQ